MIKKKLDKTKSGFWKYNLLCIFAMNFPSYPLILAMHSRLFNGFKSKHRISWNRLSKQQNSDGLKMVIIGPMKHA